MSKEKYIAFCSNYKEFIPLFYQPYWLDAVVSGGNWNACVVEEKNNIVGLLPYCYKKKLGFKKTFVPHLTPYHGCWLIYPNDQNEYEKRSFEKRIITALLNQLPDVDDIRQKLHYQYDNWLPFKWNGFQQTTAYTYTIDNTQDLKMLYDNIKPSTKRQINKGRKTLTISELKDINDGLQLWDETMKKQQITPSFQKNLLPKIHDVCITNECGKTIAAYDVNGKLHAFLFLVWDNLSVYYLLGAYNENFQTSGAMSMLFWEAITLASQKGLAFDFEGSKIEGIERFFRSFGGTLKQCHFLWKTNSKILKLAQA